MVKGDAPRAAPAAQHGQQAPGGDDGRPPLLASFSSVTPCPRF